MHGTDRGATPPPTARAPAPEAVRHVQSTCTSIRSGDGLKQVGHFALHYVEMCAAMCIGFAVGDALDFWLASLAGYFKPFNELPVLSVVLVTVFMTAPMTALMLYRGMPRRAIVEMSAAMPILAIALLALGWIGALPMSSLALAQHALMMPAMLIPMLPELDLYTARARTTTPTHRPS